VSDHPWKLVAPWYRWHVLPQDRRATAPVIQKYETAKFVTEFLADPQHFLRWDDEDWVHSTVRGRTRHVPAGRYGAGKRRKLSAYRQFPTDMRKLFLDAHKRFYLVVCELHCDVAGFPNASRDAVCEAGFVVRRRTTSVPEPAQRELTHVLTRIGTQTAALRELERLAPGLRIAIVPGNGNGAAPAEQALERELATATATLDAERRTLAELVLSAGVTTALEGWVPIPDRHQLGTWTAVTDETPQATAEEVLPLYSLVPDPTIAHHAGAGHAIWFGIVPTGNADHDDHGLARYDDHTTYEVRCYVRRHKLQCPKRLGRNDCHGELVWSEATQPYRLASHFDLVGTSNRPITIQLPDIPALRAQAQSLPPGAGSPVQMAAPANSTLNSSGMPPSAGGIGALPQICSFAIPLITIVATFVLNIFLPVVVFLFGLWELLLLKFCIFPSVKLSAGLKASLDAHIDLDLDASLSFSAQADIAAKLQTDLDKAFPSPSGGGGLGTRLSATYGINAVGGIENHVLNPPKRPSPSLTDPQYEQPVAVP
jgi:hypothetical protein